MGNVLKYINNFVYYMEPSNEDRNASSFSAIIIFYIVSYFIEMNYVNFETTSPFLSSCYFISYIDFNQNNCRI